MKDSEHVVIYITTSTDEEAQELAKVLLNSRLAACVNILPKINSLFWWDEKLDSAQECLMMVKSRTSLLDEIITSVKEVHRYETPEIVALPIVAGNPDYLEWINKEVK